jgi:hypothetical protein
MDTKSKTKDFSRLVLIITLIIFSCQTSNAQSPQINDKVRNKEVEKELKELVSKWDNAVVNRDIVVLNSILADEFTLSGVNKSQYLKFIKSPGNTVVSASSGNFDIRVYNDMAILIAINTVELMKNTKVITERYRYIDVWLKRKGKWLCIFTESNQIK